MRKKQGGDDLYDSINRSIKGGKIKTRKDIKKRTTDQMEEAMRQDGVYKASGKVLKRINTGRKPNSWEPEGGLQESDGKVKKAKIKGWDHLIGKDFSDKKKSGKKKIVTDRKKKSKLEKERSKTDDMVKTMTEKIRIKSRKKNINETLERMK